MNRKTSIFAILLIAVMLVVTACGSNNSGSSGSSGSSSGSSGGNSGSSASGGEEITIRYWDLVDPKGEGPRSEALANAIADFESQNPGIKVETEVLPWAQIPSQFMQASGANKAPDVVRILGQDIMQQIQAGNLMPLDDFADASFKEDWLLGWDTLVYDGKKMALPYEYRAPVMYYRSDFLNGQEPPKSWDDMLASAQQLSNDNRSGVVVGLSRGSQAQALSEVLLSYIWDAGADLFDSEGKAAFNNEKGYLAFEKFANLVKEGYTSDESISYTYEEVFQSIKAGTGVYSFLGSHRAAAVRAAATDLVGNLHITALPGFGNDGTPAPAHVFGWTLAISKNTKHADAAWKFIAHLTTAETQLNQVKLTGELPTRKSPYDDSYFNSDAGKEQAALAAYMQNHGRTSQYSEHYTQLTEFWADALQEIILKNTDIKTAVDNAASKYNALLK